MKKTFLMLTIYAVMISINLVYALTTENGLTDGQDLTSMQTDREWIRVTNSYFPVKYNGKSYWYKIENGKVMRSLDGNKWGQVTSGTWVDQNGRYYRFSNNSILWSNDVKAKDWNNVDGWMWIGSDGVYYKYDKDWNLWMEKK